MSARTANRVDDILRSLHEFLRENAVVYQTQRVPGVHDAIEGVSNVSGATAQMDTIGRCAAARL